MSDRPVDNSDQQAFWSDAAGPNWVRWQSAMDALLAPILDLVLDKAALQTGEHVLDIGCGAGASTASAGRQLGATGSVTGFDISDTLLAQARNQYGDAGGVSFQLADAQTYGFAPRRYDALISRFGVMFFADSVAAFRNMATALRPGGRMVLACWGPAPNNPWFMIPAKVAAARLGKMPKTDRTLPGPFAFEDQERVIDILIRASLSDIRAETHHLDLTPRGSAQDAARLCCEIGPAEKALQHFGGDDADRATIIDGIAEAFAAMDLRIPADINLFSATKP